MSGTPTSRGAPEPIRYDRHLSLDTLLTRRDVHRASGPVRGVWRSVVALAAAALAACGGDGGQRTYAGSNTAAYERYVEAEHVHIASLTRDDDFTDLAPLGELMRGRRIIQLGESSHGSREMNQIKVRLIKYLHQHHGFDVVAFEASSFACNRGLERSGGAPAYPMINCLFGVWVTEEVLELFRYIAETQASPRPLRLAGFDVQLSAPRMETAASLSSYLGESLATAGAGESERAQLEDAVRRAHALDQAARHCYAAAATGCASFDADESVELEARLLAVGDRLDTASQVLPGMVARSLGVLMRVHAAYFSGDMRLVHRDAGMADNLTTLGERVYPDSGIVVWAHNSHVAEHYVNPWSEAVDDAPMGKFLHERWGDALYTIGLYMIAGVSADVDGTPIPVVAHEPNSLESLAASAERAQLFLPFTDSDQPGPEDDWLHRRTMTQLWGAWPAPLVPARAYDAVIVIRDSSLPDYM